MNKEIFCLLGSGNKDGYTKRLLKSFLEKFPQSFNKTIFNPYITPVMPCSGCGYCKIHTDCIYKDFSAISDNFIKSDIVVIATPVYNLSFPAPLKAVIDRTQLYYNSRFIRQSRLSENKHRTAVLIATCGSCDTRGFDIIREQLNMTFSILNTELSWEIFLPSTDAKPDISKALCDIDTAYKGLVNL